MILAIITNHWRPFAMLFMQHWGKLENKAKALMKAALDAGGKDNITVVMAQG